MRSNHGPGEVAVDRPFKTSSVELSGVSSSCSVEKQENKLY